LSNKGPTFSTNEFNNIVDALDSITDATSDNRYCIIVEPGTYTE